MLITRSRLSSTRDIRLFISFREAMADVQRFDLLDPAEVARFGGIEIVAQGVVEGFLSGIHRSPFRGFSVEFTEHRAYQPGDELRYLDWQLLARANRLLVAVELALTALRYRLHRGHQVIVLHTRDPAEAELSGPPEVRYRDPESAASLVVRPRELARAYPATVRREVDAWRTACRRHGIAYHHILTDMPFGMALRLLA